MNEAVINTLKAQRNHALDTVAELAGMLSEKDAQIEALRQELTELKTDKAPPG